MINLGTFIVVFFMFLIIFGSENRFLAVCFALMISYGDDAVKEVREQVVETKPVVEKRVEPISQDISFNPEDDETFEEYRKIVKGCERAEARFMTYFYMAEPLDVTKRLDLEKMVDKCYGLN